MQDRNTGRGTAAEAGRRGGMPAEGVATTETDSLIASDKVEGTPVYSQAGEHLGSVYTVMIEKRSGQVRYAVMSFGGFLGIGERYHPLPWEALTYDPLQGGYVVDLTREQLEAAPTYAATRRRGPTRSTASRSTAITACPSRGSDIGRRGRRPASLGGSRESAPRGLRPQKAPAGEDDPPRTPASKGAPQVRLARTFLPPPHAGGSTPKASDAVARQRKLPPAQVGRGGGRATLPSPRPMPSA